MVKKSTFTGDEARQIEALIEQKLQVSGDKQKVIRQKIRALGFYASDYAVSKGYTVVDFRSAVKIIGVSDKKINSISPVIPNIKKIEKKPKTINDENYIIDLCDELLNEKALRQYRFDFLKGDTGRKLPVDAYYPSLKLVIEYHEKQHTEEVKFFDKRITKTGITRGEQRKLYDELRQIEIPKNGLHLVVFDCTEFAHHNNKRLVRQTETDKVIIKKKLKGIYN